MAATKINSMKTHACTININVVHSQFYEILNTKQENFQIYSIAISVRVDLVRSGNTGRMRMEFESHETAHVT